MYRRNLHKWMHEVRYSHPVMLNRAHSPFCHAERSEASMHWIPHCVRNDKKSMRNDIALVLLSRAKHPHRTGFLTTLGMTENGLADYRTIFGGYKL